MKKETTQKIKGIAILIMIAHHFLVYDFGVTFSQTWLIIGQGLKICVGIYAVLSGYGYYYAKEKTLSYGMKKYWGLLQEYWFSLFTIFIPCALMGGWKLTAKGLLINLFALGPNLNWNAWYVYFFLFCMVIMPLVYRMFRWSPAVNICIAIMVPYVLEALIHTLFPKYQEMTLLSALFNCMLYLGVFLIGYLMAQYNVISKFTISRFLGLLCMIGVLILRIAFYKVNTYGFNIEIFFAPLFVVSAAKYFEGSRFMDISLFSVLGKFSTGMWFIHAVFFATYTKDYFLPLMTAVKWPPLMFVWLVLMSFVLAAVYRKTLDGLQVLFLSNKDI